MDNQSQNTSPDKVYYKPTTLGCVKVVAFWVTNPCRITRKVKQTKMYVCTLEGFILVDIWIHCCASWN